MPRASGQLATRRRARAKGKNAGETNAAARARAPGGPQLLLLLPLGGCWLRVSDHKGGTHAGCVVVVHLQKEGQGEGAQPHEMCCCQLRHELSSRRRASWHSGASSLCPCKP